MSKTVYPYIPNSATGTKAEMLRALNIQDEMELYRDIPEDLRFHGEMDLPNPIKDEYSIRAHVEKLMSKNASAKTHSYFIGAGCQHHYTPAVCDEVIGRGEFLTAYGGIGMADHGKWQAIWEYQAQMSELLDVEFIGFPQYDGAWSLAHAMRICARITERSQVLVPKSMNPMILQICRNYVDGVDKKVVDIIEVEYQMDSGLLDIADLKSKLGSNTACVIVENPSFLGSIEIQVEEICKLSKQAGAEFVVYTDPLSLGVMEPPANYGADITVGDIHNLGLHMGAGGCHGGFIGLKAEEKYLSNYKDLAISVYPTITGKYGFIWWNFEASSYGIRDEANEFTGTASNLWGISAGVYLSLMGPKGMEEIGALNMKRAQYAAEKLAALDCVSQVFNAPFYNEFALNFDKSGKSVAEINAALLKDNIFGGYDLSRQFPELGQSALYCVTEVNTKDDIDRLVSALGNILL